MKTLEKGLFLKGTSENILIRKEEKATLPEDIFLAGTFQSMRSQSNCSICPVGTYSKAGSSMCTDCEAGRQQTLSGQADCVLCGYGKFKESSGTDTCSDCPPVSIN